MTTDTLRRRSVGQIHAANRARTKATPIIADATGRIVGRNDEHWSGRIDAAVDAPATTVAFRPGLEYAELAGHRLAAALRRGGIRGGAVTASGVFGPTLRDVYDTTQLAIDVDSDTFDVRLIDNTPTPDFDTHDLWADLSSAEISGTGYTADGQAISGLSVSLVSGSHDWDATDTTWSSSTITARAAVIVDDTLTGDPLIVLLDFGSDIASTAGDFTIQYASGGFWQHDYTP